MTLTTVSRRMLLGAGYGALAAMAGTSLTAKANVSALLDSNAESTIRHYYAAWKIKDWQPFDNLLTDNFTFTSAAGDDHINKSVFKTKCWDTQSQFIDRFDLLHVFGSGNEAFAMYVCHTKNNKTFRNVEYVRVRGDKVEAIECYFGARSSFPSAVSAS